MTNWSLLIDGNREEQIGLAWLAICRRYRFIYDFTVDVVRETLGPEPGVDLRRLRPLLL